MNVVDAGGWLEYLMDGPHADFFAEPIEDIANLLVPATCILEAFTSIVRRWGEEEALQAAAAMGQGRIMELDTHLAIEGARLSASAGLSLSNGVVLAAARSRGATLWSRDPVFCEFAEVRSAAPGEPGGGMPSTMVRRVSRASLGEERSDVSYWRSRPAAERLKALEEIRREYHRWHYDAEPRLQRVHRVAER